MSVSKIELSAVTSKLQVKESAEVKNADVVEKGSSVQEAKLSKIEFSDNAKIYMQAIEAVKSAPDVRFEKVAELKAAIESGNYKVDAVKIAEKMLRSHLVEQ